jgi:hypothetical protein
MVQGQPRKTAMGSHLQNIRAKWTGGVAQAIRAPALQVQIQGFKPQSHLPPQKKTHGIESCCLSDVTFYILEHAQIRPCNGLCLIIWLHFLFPLLELPMTARVNMQSLTWGGGAVLGFELQNSTHGGQRQSRVFAQGWLPV